MKRNLLATIVATLCSGAAFAAPLATNTGVPTGLVTYYIAGASAQAGAVTAVLPTDAFFASPTDVVKLTGGSVNDARYGLSNPAVTGGVSVPLLIVYRNSNGSGSGVRQLQAKTLSDISAIVSVPAINLDNTGLVTLASCGAVTGLPGAYTAACTSTEARVPDVALSDVAPLQLPGVFPSGDGYVNVADLVATRNALQGFGVAVNDLLYTALQTQNVAEGTLPATCNPSTATPAVLASSDCQPTIRKATYASLIAAEGTIKDAAGLLGSANTTEVTVCRRVDVSGTQATSNLFFLNNVCGTVGFQGALNPVGFVDSSPGSYVINEGSSTSNIKACLNATGGTPAGTTNGQSLTKGYRIGVMSLENVPGGAELWKFVKLDGVSPNYTFNGTSTVLDSKSRQQMASGSYTYALEMYSAVKPTASDPQLAFAAALNSKLGDSTLSDLGGIAYLDLPANYVRNSTSNKQSRVSRQGNNCGPLVP